MSEAKICPLMSKPLYEGDDVSTLFRTPCEGPKCELWAQVYTTESMPIQGCSLRLRTGMNSDGHFVV